MLPTLLTDLIRFLAAQVEFDYKESRRTLVKQTGLGRLAQKIDWSGPTEDFCGHLIEAISEEGQASLVEFLGGLESLLKLGIEDQERLRELGAAVKNLESAEFDEIFLGQTRRRPALPAQRPPAPARAVPLRGYGTWPSRHPQLATVGGGAGGERPGVCGGEEFINQNLVEIIAHEG